MKRLDLAFSLPSAQYPFGRRGTTIDVIGTLNVRISRTVHPCCTVFSTVPLSRLKNERSEVALTLALLSQLREDRPNRAQQ